MLNISSYMSWSGKNMDYGSFVMEFVSITTEITPNNQHDSHPKWENISVVKENLVVSLYLY